MNHQEKNRRVADHQRESLTNSHLGSMAMLQSMLDQAMKGEIRRMREGWLGNAEADCRRQVEGFGEAVKKANLTTDLMAYGVIALTQEKIDG